MTLSGATTPGQSGTGSGGNEWVFCIPQSSSITGTLSSDGFESDQDTHGGYYPTAEVQLVYSPA